MSADADSADKSQYVQSLARGLSVISAFDAAQPVMTLSDVARHTGLTRATARRFLLTLESLGYVRSDGRMFELTPKVLQLGYSYLSALSLPQIANPHLKNLSDTLQESTSLSVLDGQDIVYVARVATHRIMTVAIAVGTRFPAYATSMGRVLLAGLTAKELGVSQSMFTAYLVRKKYAYYDGKGIMHPHALPYRNGLFVVREFIAPNGHRGTQMLVTPKGKQVFLAERAEIIG